MARMLPTSLDPHTASPGEREVFQRLQRDPNTSDWIVLHSLDISHHVGALAGEIDFLILVPRKGVLALEVKACRGLRRANGLWYYGSLERGDPRGPFKQAAQGMHSVRSIVARHPDLRCVPFWSAVLFPYIRFEERGDEWHPWQVLDTSQFRAKPFSELVRGVLDSARHFLASHPGCRWFDDAAGEPSDRQCQVITNLLRPDFEVVQTPAQRRRDREQELQTFTEEQFAGLDAMAANSRVLFEGAAGTGKTLLAIEAARRASTAGKRTLFLCFNAMLADWLREQTKPLGLSVTTKTIHSYMLQIAPVTVEERADFWQSDLPTEALERLVGNEKFEPFDELVVDEAQDVLRDNYLDVLDLSLSGGLAAGTWRFFGDFERQAIYDSATLSLSEFCSQRGGSPARFTLTANCRNAPRIVELIRLLSRLDGGYSKILRPDSGIEPRIRFYRSADEGCRLLCDALKDFYESGLSGHDIVVLSARAGNSCAQRVAETPWADRLAPAREASADQVPYTTIHAYKGLEAAAAIITDIETVTGAGAESLFYTAITRATDRLVILVNKAAQAGLQQLIDNSDKDLAA